MLLPSTICYELQSEGDKSIYLQHEKQRGRCGSPKLPQEAATQELSRRSRLNPEEQHQGALWPSAPGQALPQPQPGTGSHLQLFPADQSICPSSALQEKEQEPNGTQRSATAAASTSLR